MRATPNSRKADAFKNKQTKTVQYVLIAESSIG